MSNIVETIKNDLINAIEADKLILPTLPEVALQEWRARSRDEL